ncbi:MAG: hypothetical protein GY744_12940, partial [Gammaproteobacteria bacterium]|nr:hypothetical protein [Gammaproteobacteria bacterium]
QGDSLYRGSGSHQQETQHLQDKGALPPPPNLLPATRASPESDWFASHRFFTPPIATHYSNWIEQVARRLIAWFKTECLKIRNSKNSDSITAVNL